MEKEKTLCLYRCGIWYEGEYLDEEFIPTEEFTDFENTFSQERWTLEEKAGYKIEDHYNNPWTSVEQFTYYFDKGEEDKGEHIVVYVQPHEKKDSEGHYVYDENKKCIYNGLSIGINFRSSGADTVSKLVKQLQEYSRLRQTIAAIFKDVYGIRGEENETNRATN